MSSKLRLIAPLVLALALSGAAVRLSRESSDQEYLEAPDVHAFYDIRDDQITVVTRAGPGGRTLYDYWFHRPGGGASLRPPPRTPPRESTR